jgi:hypothetical protein
LTLSDNQKIGTSKKYLRTSPLKSIITSLPAAASNSDCRRPFSSRLPRYTVVWRVAAGNQGLRVDGVPLANEGAPLDLLARADHGWVFVMRALRARATFVKCPQFGPIRTSLKA